jgi:hypothetical protein
MFAVREFVDAGGMLSFGVSFATIAEDEPIRWEMSDLNTGRWGTFPPDSWRQEGSAFAGVAAGRADTSASAREAAIVR